MMNKNRFLWVGCLIIICQGLEINPASGHEPGLSVIVHRVQRPPKINGKLDDAAWQSASKFELVWTAADKSMSENVRTQAMVAYDETTLYIAFWNRDPDTANLLSNASEHDKGVPGDDSVGIILEVGNTGKGALFNISVNSANVTYDTWMPSEELSEKLRNGEIPSDLIPIALAYPKGTDWEPKGLKTATYIEKGFWTVEMKIPFEDLLQSGTPAGKVWGINFVRHVPGLEDVWVTWSKVGRSFFKPDKFGDLIFSE